MVQWKYNRISFGIKAKKFSSQDGRTVMQEKRMMMVQKQMQVRSQNLDVGERAPWMPDT